MTPVADDLATWVDRRRAEVDAALESALPVPPACPAVLADAMRYSVRAGGKRLRPLLALAAAETVASKPGASLAAVEARALAMTAACALELIHTYSLVHDDLPAMDDDVLRRGQPTLHVVHGEAMAILAGDALLTQAFHLLARTSDGSDPVLADRRLQVLALVAEASGAAGMVGGQALDVAASAPGESNAPALVADAAGLRDMHARKTGALIRVAAVSGAVLAGGSPQVTAAIDAFATDVGLAFQIVDDILDVEGDAASLGKTAGKDAAAGKVTYPALFGLERSRWLADEAIGRAESALVRESIPPALLMGIAGWVVKRRS
jgi:geranylgeranyl diphosphate synthase, type II